MTKKVKSDLSVILASIAIVTIVLVMTPLII